MKNDSGHTGGLRRGLPHTLASRFRTRSHGGLDDAVDRFGLNDADDKSRTSCLEVRLDVFCVVLAITALRRGKLHIQTSLVSSELRHVSGPGSMSMSFPQKRRPSNRNFNDS